MVSCFNLTCNRIKRSLKRYRPNLLKIKFYFLSDKNPHKKPHPFKHNLRIHSNLPYLSNWSLPSRILCIRVVSQPPIPHSQFCNQSKSIHWQVLSTHWTKSMSGNWLRDKLPSVVIMAGCWGLGQKLCTWGGLLIWILGK